MMRTRTEGITKDSALEELQRYRQQYPNVPPEVPAFGLIRRADSWEEILAIEAAVNQILKES